MTLSADLLRGYTEAIILRQLADEDCYGYLINKRVSERSAGEFEFKEATLYPTFRRLEQNGLIRSYWGDENSGARRRYYAITDEGRASLSDSRDNWEQTKKIIDKLLEG
jgi:PadR family transcriptional regulator PadR